MSDQLDALAMAMVEHDAGNPGRIQHFFKVHAFSRLIGIQEGLDADTLLRLEVAAYVHDIGIRPAEEKYGSSDGPLQEREGPGPARILLERLGFPSSLVERVCYLIAHHHTYTNIEGQDYQILVEADFLVNLYEGKHTLEDIRAAYAHIFRTSAGRALCTQMFGL